MVKPYGYLNLGWIDQTGEHCVKHQTESLSDLIEQVRQVYLHLQARYGTNEERALYGKGIKIEPSSQKKIERAGPS